jgi:hypothetical protein
MTRHYEWVRVRVPLGFRLRVRVRNVSDVTSHGAHEATVPRLHSAVKCKYFYRLRFCLLCRQTGVPYN